ncbi:MAG: aspartyl protease family protein [Rikenellaceae bacterium]|nr:aspartyl protease family protein [Rikenellaceae bacterium]
MKTYLKGLMGLLALGIQTLPGQTLQRGITDTVRFEIVDHKMILEARLNGRSARFIFDTGGRNVLVSDTVAHYGLQLTGRESVSDVNSIAGNFSRAAGDSLSFGQHYTLTRPEFIVMPPNRFFQSLGVAGILGCEAFSQAAVLIDKQQGLLILSYPYRPPGFSRQGGVAMQVNRTYHPIFSVTMNGTSVDVLFDTGMSGFLSLAETDRQRLRSSGITVRDRGEGFMHVGIGGIDGVKPGPIERVEIERILLGEKLFTHTGALTAPRSLSIIRISLLDYGRILLDLPRSRFYFVSWDAEPSDLREQTRVWNVKIMPVRDHFEVTAVIGASEARRGDTVWKIEDTDLEGFPLDETLIMRLMEHIEKDRATLLIGKNREEAREIEIKKL